MDIQRTLRLIEKLINHGPFDEDSTLAEVKVHLQNKIEGESEDRTQVIIDAFDKWTGKYIELRTENGLIADTSQRIYIESMEHIGYCTEHKPIFSITGTLIKFSSSQLLPKVRKGRLRRDISLRKLAESTMITKESFNNDLQKVSAFQKMHDKLVENKFK